MNKIDLTIPTYSKYFLGLNIPYTFAHRHLNLASEKKLLIEKIQHIAYTILLCIPLLGHGMAFIAYSNYSASLLSNKKIEQETRMKEARRILYEQMKENPYLKSNAYIVEPSKKNKDLQKNDPLSKAIIEEDLKTIQEILQDPYYKSINRIDTRKGRTPLILSILKNKEEIFNLLINHKKIDLNLNSKNFGTALHVACSLGKKGEPFIKALLT